MDILQYTTWVWSQGKETEEKEVKLGIFSITDDSYSLGPDEITVLSSIIYRDHWEPKKKIAFICITQS